jgi:hypothetical protein
MSGHHIVWKWVLCMYEQVVWMSVMSKLGLFLLKISKERCERVEGNIFKWLYVLYDNIINMTLMIM